MEQENIMIKEKRKVFEKAIMVIVLLTIVGCTTTTGDRCDRISDPSIRTLLECDKG